MSAPAEARAFVGDRYTPSPLATAVYLGLFVGIPLLVMVLIAAVTLRRPKAVGALHYRPGRPWAHEQEWFGEQPPTELPHVVVIGGGGARGTW